MSEAKAYTGGCQCGQVRYEVELDLAKPVISCNCWMCGRSGTLLTFVPADRFKLLSGERSLTDYQFNHLVIHQRVTRGARCGPVCRAGPSGRSGAAR